MGKPHRVTKYARKAEDRRAKSNGRPLTGIPEDWRTTGSESKTMIGCVWSGDLRECGCDDTTLRLVVVAFGPYKALPQDVRYGWPERWRLHCGNEYENTSSVTALQQPPQTENVPKHRIGTLLSRGLYAVNRAWVLRPMHGAAEFQDVSGTD